MKSPLRALCAVAVVAGLAASTVGCSDDTSTPSMDPSAPPDGSIGGDITVLAATSLRAGFSTLGDQFKAAHPGTNITFTFAISSDLSTKLTQGLPGDVFASADEKNMFKVVSANLVAGQPVKFATNALTIVTQKGNPKGVRTFADLASPGVAVAVCAVQVPCGSLTERLEEAAGVTLSPAAEENTSADVLGKVTAGAVDAALVYVTDAKAAGDKVATVEFPESDDVVNTYPIGVLKVSRNARTAQAFADLVTGPEGQKVLGQAGFGVP